MARITGVRSLAAPARGIIRSPINNKRPAEWLSKETGMPILVLPYTTGGNVHTETLHGLFDTIMNKLVEISG